MSILQLVGILVTSISLLLVAVASYRRSLHPLSRVPGPALASISNIWHAYHVRNGAMLELGKTLHKQYGHVVRVGPDEVWFDTAEAFRRIYSASNSLEKSDFYLATALRRPKFDRCLQIDSPDALDLLAERDMKRYRLQRRLIGPVYHINNLKNHEPALDDVLKKVVTKIKSLQGAEVDLKLWMHMIVVECLGAVSLSWSPGFLKGSSDGGSGEHSYLGWRRKSVFGLFPLAVVGESYSKWFGRKFANLWGLTYKTPPGFNPFFTRVSRLTTKRVTAALRVNSPKDTRSDLLADLIRLHKEKPEFKESYLRRMATTNFGAGHETTTSAATAVIAMIGSHPNEQRKIAEEVRSTSNPSNFDNAVRLLYTQASIKEAQRLYPVIGMSLPRKVGHDGLHLHGHYFPPGTTVGCNPGSLHRNEDIFGPDADTFHPERWLQEAGTKDMDRCNLTFGGGARTCPGRQLAELILYKLIPTLVEKFDLEVTMPPEREVKFYFMAMLTGVRVRFLPKSNRT